MNQMAKFGNPIIYNYPPPLTSMAPTTTLSSINSINNVYALPPYLQVTGESSSIPHQYGLNNGSYHQQNIPMSMSYGDNFYHNQSNPAKYQNSYLQGAPLAYYSISTLNSLASFPTFQSEQDFDGLIQQNNVKMEDIDQS